MRLARCGPRVQGTTSRGCSRTWCRAGCGAGAHAMTPTTASAASTTRSSSPTSTTCSALSCRNPRGRRHPPRLRRSPSRILRDLRQQLEQLLWIPSRLTGERRGHAGPPGGPPAVDAGCRCAVAEFAHAYNRNLRWRRCRCGATEIWQHPAGCAVLPPAATAESGTEGSAAWVLR